MTLLPCRVPVISAEKSHFVHTGKNVLSTTVDETAEASDAPRERESERVHALTRIVARELWTTEGITRPCAAE
jgi:hypothetical protein